MTDRAQTFTEQARRAQLLNAAIDTVNDLGYPRTSLLAIAKRAGVAKSAISYYFSSKDALLLAGILEQGIAQGVFRRMPPNTAVKLVEALLDVPTTELQHNLDADLAELNAEILGAVLRVLEPAKETSAQSRPPMT